MKLASNLLQIFLGASFAMASGCSTLFAARIPSSTQPVILAYPKPAKVNKMPFLEHTGAGRFDNTLALNLPYAPIVKLRDKIEKVTGKQLLFFQGWHADGEAHVTTITPVEFTAKLKGTVSIEEINEIALKYDIQQSDLSPLGIGSGSKVIDGIKEETFFVILESQRLRIIRKVIWDLFAERVRAKAGDPNIWDHAAFYPHITIGFTKSDIHEPDVLKNMSHSFDQRFFLDVK